MSNFIILDADRPYTQTSWLETKDAKERVIHPARPARDEMEISVRVDGQYRAVLRLPKSSVTGLGRRAAIAAACKKFALGEEIASGIQVVEVEERFTPAREAMVTPEEKDAQGNIIRPESFTPAQPESTEFPVTLRLQGRHLTKVSITPAELAQPGWKQTLAQKITPVEVFEVSPWPI